MSLTLIFTIATGAASFYAWNNPAILQKWIFNPYRIKRSNEYYRFVTSGFIHNDVVHLAFNLIVFYMFGNYVERILIMIFSPGMGQLLFALLYLLGIVVSSIPTFIKYRELPHYNSLGASGGVSSILFSFVLFRPMSELAPYGIQFLALPAFIWAAIYMIYSYYMGKRGGDNINHDAHLYGALFGVLFIIVIHPKVVVSFLRQIQSFAIF